LSGLRPVRRRLVTFSTVTYSLLFLFLLLPTGGASVPSGDLSGCPCGELIERVDRTELERIVRDLSGADTIVIGGDPVALKTRYALSPQKDLAVQYLVDEIVQLGYQPFMQTFILRIVRPDLTGIAASPGGDTVWTGDLDGNVYLSTSTAGWDDFRFQGQCEGEIFDLVVGPHGRLWAACGLPGTNRGGLFSSRDGGRSWELVFTGSSTYSLFTITFEDPQVGIAAGSRGTVLRTGDMGQSWWPLLHPEIFHYRSINGSATSGTLHFWLVTDAGGLYESTDGGGTWTERYLTIERLSSIDFYDSQFGVIVGAYVAFYTKDGGVNWTEVPIDAELRDVSMVDSLRVLAGGVAGEIWFSEDGGAVWTRISDSCAGEESIWRIAAGSGGRYWLAGGNEVRRVDIEAPSLVDCSVYQLADTILGKNIGFRLEGEVETDSRVLLTAHFDSYSGTPDECAPGADDNATGVAAVLECARALWGEWTRCTVEFLLFDGEEIGLRGSRYYADYMDTNITNEAVLNLDMLGYDHGEDGSFVIAGSTDPIDSTMAVFISETVDSLELFLYPEFVTDENLASDHMSFWDLGIPSVLIIEGRRAQLNPYYHTCGDIADVVHFDYLEDLTKLALGTVAGLAGYRPSVPDSFTADRVVLRQNWPNPFSSATVVSFFLPRPALIELAVYDVSGRRVTLLERGRRDAGIVELGWDGRDDHGRMLASGVYFLRLRAGEYEDVRKMIVLR